MAVVVSPNARVKSAIWSCRSKDYDAVRFFILLCDAVKESFRNTGENGSSLYRLIQAPQEPQWAVTSRLVRTFGRSCGFLMYGFRSREGWSYSCACNSD